MVETLVRVDTLDGSIHFMDGWSDFVASERIVTGDIGHFVLVEPHRLVRLTPTRGPTRSLN